MLSLAVVDIECSQLESDKGIILTCGVKPLGKPGYLLSIDEFGYGQGRRKLDHRLSLAVRDELEKYDGWITWNGLLFDLPYIDDRLTICGEDTLEKRFARGLDMMWHAAQGKARFQSRRLDSVAKSLGCPYRKTPLDKELWLDAEAEVINKFRDGKKAFKQVKEHCLADLDVTEWVFDRLKNRISAISKR